MSASGVECARETTKSLPLRDKWRNREQKSNVATTATKIAMGIIQIKCTHTLNQNKVKRQRRNRSIFFSFIFYFSRLNKLRRAYKFHLRLPLSLCIFSLSSIIKRKQQNVDRKLLIENETVEEENTHTVARTRKAAGAVCTADRWMETFRNAIARRVLLSYVVHPDKLFILHTPNMEAVGARRLRDVARAVHTYWNRQHSAHSSGTTKSSPGARTRTSHTPRLVIDKKYCFNGRENWTCRIDEFWVLNSMHVQWRAVIGCDYYLSAY